MSTRSTIALETIDGTTYTIYCHSDGYLEHNGFILYAFYDNEKAVQKLIRLGDLSSLGIRIGQKCDFDKSYYDVRCAGQCISYMRDGDEDEHFTVTKTRYERRRASYNYIFRNKQWYVDTGKDGRLILLKNALKDNDVVKKNGVPYVLWSYVKYSDEYLRLIAAGKSLVNKAFKLYTFKECIALRDERYVQRTRAF